MLASPCSGLVATSRLSSADALSSPLWLWRIARRWSLHAVGPCRCSLHVVGPCRWSLSLLLACRWSLHAVVVADRSSLVLACLGRSLVYEALSLVVCRLSFVACRLSSSVACRPSLVDPGRHRGNDHEALRRGGERRGRHLGGVQSWMPQVGRGGEVPTEERGSEPSCLSR